MQISRAGYAVRFVLLELYEPFQLVQTRVLPFSMTENSQMVRFKLENELVAANSVGKSFLFPVGICTWEQDLRVCDIRLPVTWVESLLTELDELPDLYKKATAIVTPIRPEYIYHELENRMSVFSHVKENFTITCGDTTS